MQKRILYVEDVPSNMLLVQRILHALGHELLEATDGETGWRLALRHRPDLILVDLRLPGELDGFELIRRIKSHPEISAIPVVVLTAFGHEEVEEQAIAAGCDGFLSKPADIRQIRAALDRFLNEPLITPDAAAESLASAAYTFI